MYKHTIPMLSYIFIGITTLVLTYVTVMEKSGDANDESNEPAIDMLSNADDANKSVEEPIVAAPIEEPVAVPVEAQAQVQAPVAVPVQAVSNGGKGKKTKCNRNVKNKTKQRRK